MIKTAVVCFGQNDLEYGRMLETELEDMGVFTGNVLPEDADVIIAVNETVDGSFIGELEKRNKTARVILAYWDEGDGVPPSVVPIRRPIRTEKLRTLLRQLCVQGQLPAANTSVPEGLTLKDGEVYYGKNAVKLSKKEFELFKLLYLKKGTAVSARTIKNEVFPESSDSNVANVYINYLRKKIDFKYDIRSIITVRNRGYMLKL